MKKYLNIHGAVTGLQIFLEENCSLVLLKLYLKVTERVGNVAVAAADDDDDVDFDELQPLTLGQSNGAKRQKYGSLANKDSTTRTPTHLIKHKVGTFSNTLTVSQYNYTATNHLDRF